MAAFRCLCCNAQPVQASPVSTLTLQVGLPWTGPHEEDRRFHRILLQTLLICLTAGAITPYIRIPLPAPGEADDLPPRRVRLLAMPAVSGPRPAPVLAPAPTPAPTPAPAPETTAVTAAAEPQAAPRQPPAAPVVTPREKAATTGVLAMSDALARLRSTTPKTGPAGGQDRAPGGGQEQTAAPSMLTTNVTRGSQGIEGGVAHQSVLGAAGLPDREAARQGAGGGDARGATGAAATPAAGRIRSGEQIQEVLDRNKGAMYTLYNRELRKDASLQGKLVLSITIAPAGNVTRCVVLSSELGSDSLEQQLVALIKRIDFGSQPEVPAVTTKIPIEFFPR